MIELIKFDRSNLYTVGEIIDGYIGNMSDDEIDNDLRLFKRIARYLGVKRYDDVVAYMDGDSEYNIDNLPDKKKSILKTDGDIKYASIEDADTGEDIKLVCEVRNGITYLYFRDEESCEDYIDQVDSYYLMSSALYDESILHEDTGYKPEPYDDYSVQDIVELVRDSVVEASRGKYNIDVDDIKYNDNTVSFVVELWRMYNSVYRMVNKKEFRFSNRDSYDSKEDYDYDLEYSIDNWVAGFIEEW